MTKKLGLAEIDLTTTYNILKCCKTSSMRDILISNLSIKKQTLNMNYRNKLVRYV